MVNEIHQQVLANYMKAIIMETPAHGNREIVARKRKAISLLQDFEACDWHAWMFEEAVAAAAPDLLVLEADALVYLPREDRPGEAVDALTAVLIEYNTKAGCAAPSDQPVPTELTVREAADYLGLSVAAVRKYIQQYRLVGVARGNMLFFKTDDLDTFKEEPRPVGRPRKES